MSVDKKMISPHNEWYIGDVLVCAPFSSILAHEGDTPSPLAFCVPLYLGIAYCVPPFFGLAYCLPFNNKK